MTKLHAIALILIATGAENTWAAGAKVYKCGSTYSQTPCEGAVPVQVEDSRSQDQKSQSEAVAKQQAQTANALEKTRLKEEAQAQAQAAQLRQANAQAAAQASKKRAAPATSESNKPPVLNPPKSKGKGAKEAEYFTAKENKPAGTSSK